LDYVNLILVIVFTITNKIGGFGNEKVLSLLFITSLFFVSNTTVAAAEGEQNQEFEINSINELKDFVKTAEESSENDVAEREYIFENTNPEVLQAYTSNFFNEAKSSIEQLSNDGLVTDTNKSLNAKTDSINLPSGGVRGNRRERKQ